MSTAVDLSKLGTDHRILLRAVARAGHSIEWAGDGHIRLRHADTGEVRQVAATPSDSRWRANTVAELQRAGFLFTNPFRGSHKGKSAQKTSLLDKGGHVLTDSQRLLAAAFSQEAQYRDVDRYTLAEDVISHLDGLSIYHGMTAKSVYSLISRLMAGRRLSDTSERLLSLYAFRPIAKPFTEPQLDTESPQEPSEDEEVVPDTLTRMRGAVSDLERLEGIEDGTFVVLPASQVGGEGIPRGVADRLNALALSLAGGGAGVAHAEEFLQLIGLVRRSER